MLSPKYRIYPSLLDKFQKLLDSDMEAEAFWNIDSETGEQKLTAEEIAARQEEELLNAINRIPMPPVEAADKGTCFNEIVDCLIMGKNTDRKDMTIESIPDPYLVCDSFCKAKNCDFRWTASKEECLSAYQRAREGKCRAVAIKATLNGFEFLFDYELCKSAAEYFGKNSVPQHFCKGYIQTSAGLVELYGYIDEIVMDKVFDIKTTSSYAFGKFEQAWQKLVYPYCLVQSGDMPSVSSFEYTVFQLSKPSSRNPYIGGKMYCEEYTYDHAYAEDRLRNMLEVFIAWLEQHRDKITDQKIFGGDVHH